MFRQLRVCIESAASNLTDRKKKCILHEWSLGLSLAAVAVINDYVKGCSCSLMHCIGMRLIETTCGLAESKLERNVQELALLMMLGEFTQLMLDRGDSYCNSRRS